MKRLPNHTFQVTNNRKVINNHSQVTFNQSVVVGRRSVEDQVWRTVQDVVELCVWIWEKGNVEVQTVTEWFLLVRKLQRPQRKRGTNSSNSHPDCRRPRTRQVHTGATRRTGAGTGTDSEVQSTSWGFNKSVRNQPNVNISASNEDRQVNIITDSLHCEINVITVYSASDQ